jgi:hypothetical protein
MELLKTAIGLLPTLSFFGTGAAMFGLIIRSQRQFFQAIKMIKITYREEGRNWDYWSDLGLRLRMIANPEVLFEESDSSRIRALKQEAIRHSEEMKNAGPMMIIIMLCGAGLTLVLGIISEIALGLLSGSR